MSSSGPIRRRVLRTAFHIEEEKLNKTFKDQVYCKSFLMGSHQRSTSSPVKMFQGKPGIMRLIHDFAKPDPPNEDQFYYKMGIVMCTGVEHVHMEALQEVPELTARGVGAGSLMNQPIGSCKHFIIEEFLEKYAWKKNEDGSFWNEGQLRVAWKEFCVPRFCAQPEGRCRGRCCALMGDTIMWRPDDIGYRVSFGPYKPASQACLIERGFVIPGKGLAWMGELYQYAKLAREGGLR